MSSYKSVKLIRDADTEIVAGITTGTNVGNSPSFPISKEESVSITVDIEYSDAVIVGSITAKLQSTVDGVNWDFDHGTVVITGAVATRTVKSIDLDMNITGDQSLLPIRPRARVVIVNTDASDTVTLDQVYVSRKTNQ